MDYVTKFINELSTRYLSINLYNPDSKQMEQKLIQMRVCPVQLWDVSYPVEHRDVIHTTIFGKDASGSKPINKRLEPMVWATRKALGLQPLPDFKKDMWLPMSPPEHIETIAIGVKDDYWVEPDGKHVSTKEKSEFAYEGI